MKDVEFDYISVDYVPKPQSGRRSIYNTVREAITDLPDGSAVRFVHNGKGKAMRSYFSRIATKIHGKSTCATAVDDTYVYIWKKS